MSDFINNTTTTITNINCNTSSISDDIDYTKLVSIIMPIYNAELYIEEALDSVLKQIYRPLEIIIYNDNSNDNTINIIINKYINLFNNNNIYYNILNTNQSNPSNNHLH